VKKFLDGLREQLADLMLQLGVHFAAMLGISLRDFCRF
jgi:hypothetical protein